jgi:hypothetical protein
MAPSSILVRRTDDGEPASAEYDVELHVDRNMRTIWISGGETARLLDALQRSGGMHKARFELTRGGETFHGCTTLGIQTVLHVGARVVVDYDSASGPSD